MRTSKYRGKDVKTGEWKYGHLITLNVNDKTAYLIITDDYAVVDKELKPWEIAFFLNVDIFMVDPNTVGQFTGLLDKNGKEIYEGDIVNVRVTNDRFKKNPRFRNGVVTFCEYDGGWMVGCYYRFLPKRMEVIGNIQDNSELLRR